MKKYNFLAIISLVIISVSCKEEIQLANSVFTLKKDGLKPKSFNNDTIRLEVQNQENKEIDSIIYYANELQIGKVLHNKAFDFELKNQGFGYLNLKATVYYDGKSSDAIDRVEVVSEISPKLLKYKIINTFNHDVNSFTEGLEFYNDTLYESTGLKGKSYCRKYDYKTGKIYQQTDLEAQYFGEGITIINNKLFFLTWQDQKGFIYNPNTLKLEKSFDYDRKIEGWGMTNDGKYIYHTDKTEKIWKMDPDTQKLISYMNVYSGQSKIPAINELEWVDGKIYANVWQKDAIAVINANNGAVDGILDMSGLRLKTTAKETDFLNGIAYNTKTKTFFVTGKNWNKLFEITIME
jgi:glutaminyl-peptide cyclotransferase